MGRRDGESPDAEKSVSRRGREIYESSIRSRVEPEHDGRFLALDVSSGDYEVGDEVLPTSARLKERNPEAEIYLLRVGRRAAFRLGGAPRLAGPTSPGGS